MKGGHGFFNQLDQNYYISVRNFFGGASFIGSEAPPQIPVTNSSGKIIGYRSLYQEPTTYLDFKETIIKHSEEIKQLQDKIKQLEEKMKNNSNTGSVNSFYTATSKGGHRKTQKKKH